MEVRERRDREPRLARDVVGLTAKLPSLPLYQTPSDRDPTESPTAFGSLASGAGHQPRDGNFALPAPFMIGPSERSAVP
jgi:hypothetical protein